MTRRPDPSRLITGPRTQNDHPLTVLKNGANSKRRVARGGFVYRYGDAADPLYLVESGLVKLALCSASGRDLTLGLYGPGEVFGEEAVFESSERMSSAIAVEASVLVAIPRQFVHQLLERDSDVSAFLMRLLATRVRDSVSQIEKLAWSPVPARLAEALLRLASRAGVSDAVGTRVDLTITHQELANLIGSTRETTTATLNEFRRRGLIEFVRRQIVLLRPDLLSSLALRNG
jgi:CRP/FNR family transcriptional regulator, cyclic AMP receptor protein